MILPIK
jgi:cAMP-dependent protein kinase regulator